MKCTFNCNQGRRCSCGKWHDTQGTLAEPVGRWNVLATLFVIVCFALMAAAAWWLQ